MYKQFLFILYFLLFAFSCAPPQFTTNVIMFDTTTYKSTSPNKIVVYNSRLDIPNKYIEFGTIKFQGEPIIADIKQIAADKGADAIIKDANNFILIKFKTDQQEEKLNETKTI